MNTPNVGIPYVPQGTLDPAAGLNLALNVIDALLKTAVISMDQTAPPATGADGDLYVVAGFGGTATGDWAGHENDLARFVDDGNFWQFFEAGTQVHLVLDLETGGLYKFLTDSPSAGWVLAAGLGDAPIDGTIYGRKDASWVATPSPLTIQDSDSPPSEVVNDTELIVIGSGLTLVEDSPGVALLSASQVEFQVALSDMSTALTVGTGKAYFRAPFAFTLTAVRASVFAASSSGVVTVDVNEAGTTVLSTKLSIDSGEKTSTTAATPAVISDAGIADDAELTFDIDAAGTGAAGLIVTLFGTRL